MRIIAAQYYCVKRVSSKQTRARPPTLAAERTRGRLARPNVVVDVAAARSIGRTRLKITSTERRNMDAYGN